MTRSKGRWWLPALVALLAATRGGPLATAPVGPRPGEPLRDPIPEGSGRKYVPDLNINAELRLVALGRRTDAGKSQTFAATEDFRTLLPLGEWVHLAASSTSERAR